MTTTWGETTIDLTEATYTIYRRYKKWISFATLWSVVCNHFDNHPELTELSPKDMKRRLRRVAESAARRQKAKRSGYRWEDEYFYSLHMVEKLLPYAQDPQATPPPTLADEMQINRKHAGKEGYGGWEAAIADVRKAVAAVGSRPRAIQQFLGGQNPHPRGDG